MKHFLILLYPKPTQKSTPQTKKFGKIYQNGRYGQKKLFNSLSAKNIGVNALENSAVRYDARTTDEQKTQDSGKRSGLSGDPRMVSEEDVRALLEKVNYGELDNDTYIPLRISTPQFFVEVVSDHSNGKYEVQDHPIAAQVGHLRQNMEEDDGTSYGNHRPHDLSIDDIVTISKKMGHPSYIVLQKNGRYAEVVSFYNKQNKKVVVSIDFADSRKGKEKNYKYKSSINDFDAGYYNIIVTQYEPDDFNAYLDDCEIIYDKKKMNGRCQVGSGRVVTFTHDTPFINNSISQNDSKYNPSDKKSSEKSTKTADTGRRSSLTLFPQRISA